MEYGTNKCFLELYKYKVVLRALQETRWPEKGTIDCNKVRMFNSGLANGQYKFGTEFLMANSIKYLVINIQAINENNFFNIYSMVNAHFPTEDKESFYSILEYQSAVRFVYIRLALDQ